STCLNWCGSIEKRRASKNVIECIRKDHPVDYG
ncbi:Protein of unknown function, partial [Gryllus bimaculatus]